nr:glycosyltransferase [Azospirillum sp. INR13]
MPLAYRASDLCVMPSQALEGFGITALESLASGTPVLSPRSADCRRWWKGWTAISCWRGPTRAPSASAWPRR